MTFIIYFILISFYCHNDTRNPVTEFLKEGIKSVNEDTKHEYFLPEYFLIKYVDILSNLIYDIVNKSSYVVMSIMTQCEPPWRLVHGGSFLLAVLIAPV